MKLIADWKHIVRKAWSMRLMYLAGLFSTLEIMLPLFFTDLPRGWFAVLSMVSIVGGMAARVVAQKGFE